VEDPRAELVQKLLEYKMFKYMSFELRDRQEDAAFTMYHSQDIPPEVKAYREPVNIDDLLDGVTLSGMLKLYHDILRRQENRIDPVRSQFGQLEKEEVDMAETMQFVESYIEQAGTCTFRSILTQRRGKQYVIVAFLTLLELMKEGKVEVRQEGTFEEIYIEAV
jgi:segregation and condensation protein A